MKREILFKAKRVDNGEWVEGFVYYNASECCFQIVEFMDCPPTMSDPCGDSINVHYNVDFNTVCQFTGKTLIKGNKVFENTIAFYEEEEEYGDVRYYVVCKWIKEWCMFAWLSYGELMGYENRGIDGLDMVDYWTYPIEETEKYHYAGNYIDNPELLK